MASGLRSRKAGSASPSDDGGVTNFLSMDAVRKLASDGKVAMVVDGVAYDFTNFAKDHPGGENYLRKNMGKVATEEFVASHPVDIIERTLTSQQFKDMTLGEVDASTIKNSDLAVVDKSTDGGRDTSAPTNDGNKPTLDSCINLYDFEAIASQSVPMQGWVYYSSGADDEITLRENHNAYHRLWLKPRVMVNVKHIDMSCTMLGHKCDMPVFLSAVAMCKLGHPEGETAWMRGAEAEGIIYMIPTLSGCSFDDIVNARVSKDSPMFFQLYVNQDREKVKKIVQKAEQAGCSALFITCDAPQLGNRERDRRVKVTHSGANVQAGKSGGQAQGTSKALTTFIDPSLNWDDIPWFQSITKMRIILKGIGSAEDAVQAYKAGCAGVLLSNHGGRQLDFARAAIEVLPEVMEALREIDYDASKFEVFVDGGIRRGSDIYKALALGAKAVGVGRPALYAMSAFGHEGVARMIAILKEELRLTMQLMGTPSLKDIHKRSVDTSNLATHVSMVPPDMLQRETYIPPQTQASVNKFSRDGPPRSSAAVTNASSAASDNDEVSTGAAVLKTVTITLETVFKTVVTTDARQSINRSAVFLIVFLVVHVLGNLTFFGGHDAFNAYAAFLNEGPISPLIKAIEYYLALAFVLHAGVGAYLTIRYKKLAMGSKQTLATYPLGQAKLALTGMVITVFVGLHLFHFRFAGDNYAPSRDLYKQTLAILGERTTALFYAGSIALLGTHLYAGWGKTVNKMGLTKPYLKPVIAVGQALTVAVTVGFLACVAKAYLVANA